MKQKKMKIAIGIMLALILFTSSVALLLYSKQSDLSRYAQDQVEIYVTAKSLHKGEMITAEAVTMSSLPKSYITFTPLTEEEIIGRYARVDIFLNEPFRPEKLSLIKPETKSLAKKTAAVAEEKEKVKLLSSDSISISLSVFKNLDHSLKEGDFIDIVSVYPKKSKKNEYMFTTKYIALHLRIRSFASNTKLINKMIMQSYDEKSKKVTRDVADTVILEMSPTDIKNFFPMYYRTQELNSQRVYATKENRGHLWMVRCSDTTDKKIQTEKKRMMVDAKRSVSRVRAKVRERVSISYED